MPDPITTDKVLEIYDGNDSNVTAYPITLQWSDDADLHVLIDGVETNDFVITDDGIVTGTAIPSGTQVLLYRATPRTQILPFANNTTPSPRDVKAALNKLTLMVQELGMERELPVKSLTFPITEDPSFLTELPDAADRLGLFWFFDDTTGELTFIGGQDLIDILGAQFKGDQGDKGDTGDPFAPDSITESTTARTLALTDSGKYIRCTNAATTTITIPVTGSGVGEVLWETGAEIYFRRAGAGAIALSVAGVTVNGSSQLDYVAQHQNFCLKHLGSSVWDFI